MLTSNVAYCQANRCNGSDVLRRTVYLRHDRGREDDSTHAQIRDSQDSLHGVSIALAVIRQTDLHRSWGSNCVDRQSRHSL